MAGAFDQWRKQQSVALSTPAKKRSAMSDFTAGRDYPTYGMTRAKAPDDMVVQVPKAYKEGPGGSRDYGDDYTSMLRDLERGERFKSKPLSESAFEMGNSARELLDDGFRGFHRGTKWVTERIVAPANGVRPDSLNPVDIRKWSDSIGESSDPDLSNEWTNAGLESWRSLSHPIAGLFDVFGLGMKMWESPELIPEIGKQVVTGLVQSVNPFEKGIRPSERWGRTLNAAMLIAGALEGAGRTVGSAGKIRAKFSANTIAKEFSIPKADAVRLVDGTRIALREMEKSKGTMAPFAADVREALFGESGKSVGAVLREKMPEGTSAPMGAGARPGIASPETRLPRIGDKDSTGRIMPGHLDDGQLIVPADQIVKELYDELQMTPGRRGKTGRASEAAAYDAQSATIVTRAFDDLSTTPHELGHHLDTSYDLIQPFNKPRAKSPFDQELEQIWPGRVEPKSWTLHEKRQERFAEFVRAWTLNPEHTRQTAPQMTAYFESKVPAPVQAALQNAGQKTRRLLSQEPDVLVGQTIEARTDAIPGKLGVAVDTTKQIVGDAVARATGEARARRTAQPFGVDTISYVKTKVLDDQTPLREAGQYVDDVTGRTDKLPEEDVSLLGAKSRYVDSAVQAVIEQGVRDVNGNVVLDSQTQKPLNLQHILEPLKDKVELEEMLQLGVSQRIVAEAQGLTTKAVEEMLALRVTANELRAAGDLEGASQLFKAAQKVAKETRRSTQKMSNAGAGVYDPISVHKAHIDKMSAVGGEKLARVTEALRRYREFSDALMQFAHDSGLITTEHLDNIRAKGDSYFDLGRVVESAAEDAGITAELVASRHALGMKSGKDAAFGGFKGSTRKFESGMVNLMFNVRAIIGMAERNNLIGALVNPLIDPALTPIQKNLLSSVAQRVRSGEGGQNTVTYLRNGKTERWQLNEAVAPVFHGQMALMGDHWISAFASFFPRLLRDSVTFVPAFVARNMTRDVQSRWLVGRGKSGKSDLAELRSAYKAGPEEVAEYNAYGGGLRSTGEDFGSAKGFARMQNDAVKKAEAAGFRTANPKKALQKYNEWRDRVERSNRLVEYKRVYEQTVSELQGSGLSPERIAHNARLKAGSAARELIDFAASGQATRFINRYAIPFTSAAVAGTRASARAFMRNPKGYLMKLAVTQGTLLVAEQSWNASQGATDRYNQLPAYLKDYFACFYVAPLDMWVRIPKPHLEGVVVSGFGRAARNDWDGYAENLIKGFTPLSAEQAVQGSPLFATAGGVGSNWDNFRQAPIVPRYEEGLDVSLRDTSSASGIGQLLQQITGKDARMIDFAARGLMGNSASTVQQLSNLLTPGKTTSPAQLGNVAIGMTVDSADYSARDVVAVGELAKKSGATNPLKPLLDKVRKAEKSGDIEQIKAARGHLYEVAGRTRGRVESATEGLRGIDKWRKVKAALGG